ncbi:MAG: hypothetical protein ACU0C9_12545 [Paracoccaceae bacterium]
MGEIDELSKTYRNLSENNAKKALKRLKMVPEVDLQFWLALEPATQDRRVGIALARVEIDRRARQETRRLIRISTWQSGVLGFVAAIIGAILSYWFKS